MEQNPKIESDNNIPSSPNDTSNINTQGNQEKKSSIRFLLILMGAVELTFLASLSPLKSIVSILEFKKTIPFQIVFACIVIFASIQIILGFIFVIRYELYKNVLKKISIGALIFTPTFIILTFPLLIFTSIFPVNEEIGKVACTMEAKMCPDGSAVGRTGPNCEFAPCPTPIAGQTNLPTATPAAILQIPEIGIQVTLPLELADLRYHVERYETSTAILFTTDSLASQFPACEFPTGGLGWITQAKEKTEYQNKKIGNYYYGIETMRENCSRTPGTAEGNEIETNQKELFPTIFETIQSL